MAEEEGLLSSQRKSAFRQLPGAATAFAPPSELAALTQSPEVLYNLWGTPGSKKQKEKKSHNPVVFAELQTEKKTNPFLFLRKSRKSFIFFP